VAPTSSKEWKACLGDCQELEISRYHSHSITGGIREFKFESKYTSPDETLKSKNLKAMYTPDLKAYYRFNGELSHRFLQDEFVDRKAEVPYEKKHGSKYGI
jgi:hypothetical protein